MRVQIAARHCDIPDSLRARAERLVARLAKYDRRMSTADVVFEEEKLVRRVEVILSVHGGEPVFARAEDAEFRAALDKVVERLGRKLRRQRSRQTDHQAPPLSDGVLAD
ncbi:MAG TPA: ribosome-associated translation inhibitor RaiA [Longimicrobiales bacterium]|nr:ribosome-associated translation inhibitor RaiA [Longimicrobiales bacterium]